MKVLITGGASGLGEAISRQLAEKHEVYATYANSKDAAQQLEKEFPNIHTLKCDFRKVEEVTHLCQKIESIQPDALINNAYSGTFLGKHFHKTDSALFLNEFQDNIIPTLAITQAAIQVFRKKKEGRIVTILTSALVGNAPMGSAIYVANKAYLQKMAMVWAAENARFNISSNCISPSFMETNFTSEVDERLVDQMRENHPLKSLLDPKEVATAVAYLLQASAQVNGTEIVINAASSLK